MLRLWENAVKISGSEYNWKSRNLRTTSPGQKLKFTVTVYSN